MPSIDLNQNRASILDTYKEISKADGIINWAVFGYLDNTNILKLDEKGDGGIEEMTDSLHSGKIMYGFCRVKDPNSSLSKLVFINWQGEGAPDMRKGMCASHVREVTALFKGIHVSINARCDEDVDEDLILEKVAKSSVATYNFNETREAKENSPSPVSSVYKKTLPHVEIQNKARENFWDKSKKEEEQRLLDEKNRLKKQVEQEESERKERELKENKEREQKEKERYKKICDIRKAETHANKSQPVNLKNEQSGSAEKIQIEAMKDAEERGKRSEKLRQERSQEAKNLVLQRSNNPRAMFEPKHRSQFDTDENSAVTKPERKLKHSFLPQNQSNEQVMKRKDPITLPTNDNDENTAPPAVISSDKKENYTPSKIKLPTAFSSDKDTKPSQLSSSHSGGDFTGAKPQVSSSHASASFTEEKPKDKHTEQPIPQSAEPLKTELQSESQPERTLVKQTSLLAANLPKRQNSDDEQDTDDWDDDDNTVTPQATIVSNATVEQYNTAESAAVENPPAEVPVSEEAQQHQAVTDNRGVCAVALYDYTGADDDEISFDPNDMITNIDMIDEGWWTGIGPDGKHGMFPANYVELIQI